MISRAQATPIPEAEMVAEFLKMELPSSRFGAPIRERLERDAADETVITEPDLLDDAANAYRSDMLEEVRGWLRRELIFNGFPDDVAWYRATASQADLLRTRYIDYDYWVELSRGSRLATDAAKTINDGVEIFGVPNDGFREIEEHIRRGFDLPPLILVAVDFESDPIVLEGHARLTGYALAGDAGPAEVEVILGISPRLGQWALA